MCNILDSDRQSGEFLHHLDLTSFRALALHIRDFVCELEATYHGIPLETIGTLDRAAVILNCLALHDVTNAAGDIAKTAARDAVREVAKAARDVAKARVSHDVMEAASNVADAADQASRTPMSYFFLRPRPHQIQCFDIFAYKEVFRIPRHLVVPLLADADLRSHLHHRSGGSRVVLGGYAHLFDKDKWVPICVLDFQRLLASKHEIASTR